jgi:hypothetical protein
VTAPQAISELLRTASLVLVDSPVADFAGLGAEDLFIAEACAS